MLRRSLTIGSLVFVLLGALPAAASATFIPGPNGKLTFASGRGNSEVPSPADGDDSKAKIWVSDYPFGTPVQVTTLPANTQHRHPNWSPDHTRIVYAAGVAFSGTYALWIVDLRDGSQEQFVPAAEKQDRPSWSPDGETIAYGSLGDLWVKGVAPGSTAVNLTETAGVTEERPVWSPDGNTLYYNRGAAGDRDLYKLSPVSPGSSQIPIEIGATDDWQPALSPDGDTLCFLRGAQSDAADLYTIGVDGGTAQPFSTTGGLGDLNCVWSPDGTKILYTLGAFAAGDLITRNVNGTSPSLLSGMNVAKHFEGNADWATNFRPTCESKSAAIPVNGFTAIELDCTDPDSGAGKEAPHAEDIGDPFLEVVSQPAHGTLSGLSDRRVIYTPNKDFKGTDSFTYTGSDSVSDANPAKVTIQVGQEQQPAVDTTPPKITNVRVSAKRWLLGSRLASASRLPSGTTISFGLDEAARATVAFQRAQPGRRVGRKCAKPTAANRDRKACVRYVSAGELPAFAANPGANRVKFQGSLSRRKSLAPGTYRVVVRARDAAGNAAAKNGPSFTILSD
ncbi:MAG TPA: Ig-like domain-containing protein [Solirubrobacterales bacterium]|nr:Ig-like domain-containing protein [Solirubrobacterales bacterium]